MKRITTEHTYTRVHNIGYNSLFGQFYDTYFHNEGSLGLRHNHILGRPEM